MGNDKSCTLSLLSFSLIVLKGKLELFLWWLGFCLRDTTPSCSTMRLSFSRDEEITLNALLRLVSVINSWASFLMLGKDKGFSSKIPCSLPRLLPISLWECWLFLEVEPPCTVAMSSPLLAFSFIRSKWKPLLRLLSLDELGRFFLRRLFLVERLSRLDFTCIYSWLWLIRKTWRILPIASICWVRLDMPLMIWWEGCLSSLFILFNSFELKTLEWEASCPSVYAWWRPTSEIRTWSLLCYWPMRSWSVDLMAYSV